MQAIGLRTSESSVSAEGTAHLLGHRRRLAIATACDFRIATPAAKACGSGDFREGVQAFVAKRAPAWQGR